MTPTPKVGLITGVNMPKLNGKKYGYDKKGVKAYIQALKKKRMKPKKVKKKIYDGVNGVDSNPANTGA